MKNIGVIGKNFGQSVEREVLINHSLSWIIGSDKDYRRQSKVDLVYVASPSEFHFEQAMYFLEAGVAVILEKVPCMSEKSLEDLILKAEQKFTFIYFSDLFRFRSDIAKKLNNFSEVRWTKTTSHEDWVLSRLGFHYLYMIANKYTAPIVVEAADATKDRVKLKLVSGVNEISLDFEQNATKAEHKIDGEEIMKAPNGSINQMLSDSNLTHEKISLNNDLIRKALKIFNDIKHHMPSVAVVGGGVFGTSAAIQLAKSGLQITLFEREDDLFKCASGINQYRVHRGYHYPRSKETAASCDKDAELFKRSFRSSIEEDHQAYYAIASKDSFITSDEYKEFLEEQNLQYEITENLKGCALTVKVTECLYNPSKLKAVIFERLQSLDVNISLNTDFKWATFRNKFSHCVLATYSESGRFSDESYQFEVCEKPLVRLSSQYKGKSVVVMDGPFMCFDPFEGGDMHVLGNVEHAIHSRNTGKTAVIPKQLASYLNSGVIKDPKVTNFPKFLETYERFFGDTLEIEHIGSMYTVRTVLPNRDYDDARPTIVKENDTTSIQIFSGKVVNCVSAAREVTKLSWKKILEAI